MVYTVNMVYTRAVESDFKKSNKSRMPKSFLSNFLLTWFTLLTVFKLFILFKLLYTAETVACMPIAYIYCCQRLKRYWNGLMHF